MIETSGIKPICSKNWTGRCFYTGWLITALNSVFQAFPSEAHPYRRTFEQLLQRVQDGTAHRRVGEGLAILSRLLEDNEQGLLGSVADRASAEAFGDLLDHAEKYLGEGRKDGSGVLASAVFEDSVRRIARSNDIEVEGVKLDAVISALAKATVINGIVAKKCRTAAAIRNCALHAKWDDFTLDDVGGVVGLTRQLLQAHLAG